MLIGVIADDFTGASDIANTLAKGVSPEGGLTTAQFSGIPTKDVSSDIEAGVVSLKSRSAPVDEAVKESLAALTWLLAQGCEQIIFKYCSTFDSTPQGNIGPVAEALAKALDVNGVVVCPAFPAAGRTVYQGNLFVWDKPLNESGMQLHPVTPMIDSDIRRWLSLQCEGSVGHVGLPTVSEGPAELTEAIQLNKEQGHVFCVVDAVSEENLLTIAKALASTKLLTGGSGVAMGLPGNFVNRTQSTVQREPWSITEGPSAILVGSCSGATREQVRVYAENKPNYVIDVNKVMQGKVNDETLFEFFNDHPNSAPLVYSFSSQEDINALQAQYGQEEVSAALDGLFSKTACRLIEAGYTNMVVAGGETSGAVAQAVTSLTQVEAMLIGPEIDPGIPMLRINGKQKVTLALKSGNFGADNFFSKAIAQMSGLT